MTEQELNLPDILSKEEIGHIFKLAGSYIVGLALQETEISEGQPGADNTSSPDLWLKAAWY